jgi:predicted ATP-grasp superfamily ATP-dependent carboligase
VTDVSQAAQHHYPAVVLDLSANGIGVVRSLGRKGIKVFAFDTDPKYKNGRTRYADCSGCPHPIYEEEKLLQFLLELTKRFSGKAVLFAGADDYVGFIARNRDALSKHYYFLQPDPSLIKAVLDKRSTYDLAVKHKIPVPKTLIVGKDDKFEDFVKQMTFPCILKPADSADFRRHMNKKAIVIERPDQLKETYLHYKQYGELIIQELIPGGEDQLYGVATLFDDDMNLIAVFTGQKLHQFPPYFGSGSLVRSMRDEVYAEAGIAFMREVGFKGFAKLEYKLDKRDGQLKFLELNPRTWYWHSLAQACGVDLPYLYYLSVTGQKPQPVLEQKTGINWLYLVRDYLAFREKQRNGDAAWLPWLRSLAGKKDYALFAWDDPLPFFRISYSFLKDARAKRKAAKEAAKNAAKKSTAADPAPRAAAR